MSRRRSNVAREKNGRVQRPHLAEALLSPTEAHRLLTAATAELRDACWATQVGRLHLAGKLRASELAIAKRWHELVANYSIACRSPCPPRSVLLDFAGGQPADPDSISGQNEAKRHRKATAAFIEGRDALRLAGYGVEAAVDSVCIHDHAPAGFGELEALRRGLAALSSVWSTKRKAGAR